MNRVMGQYWVITCPGRREAFQSGKLGEWITSKYYAQLVALLSKPSPDDAKSSWAGERIICVGDYLTNEDLTAWDDKGYVSSLFDIEPALKEQSLFRVAYGSYSIPNVGSKLSYDEVSQTIDTEGKSKCHILHNLDTGEYVREDILRHGITLAHIVLRRICCSSDPSTSTEFRGGLVNGVWAGHRFEIVGSDSFSGTDGHDVSEAAWNDVVEVWQAEYGDDWPDESYV